MGLTMQERHANVRELAPRFRKARKKERSKILDEFTRLTGYGRCYAAFLLRTCGKEHVKVLSGGTRRVVFIPGHCRERGAKRHPETPLRGESLPDCAAAAVGTV